MFLFLLACFLIPKGLLTTFHAEPEMKNLIKDPDYSRALSVENWNLNRGEGKNTTISCKKTEYCVLNTKPIVLISLVNMKFQTPNTLFALLFHGHSSFLFL